MTTLFVSRNTPTSLDVHRQRRQTLHMARRIIGSLVNDLRQVDQRLGTLAATIPKPGDQFELLEEIGDGVRCVGGQIFRLPPPQFTDGAGAAVRPIDFNVPPTGGGHPGSVAAGSTWNFQFWYRDPAGGPGGFNLSDGLTVTFCP